MKTTKNIAGKIFGGLLLSTIFLLTNCKKDDQFSTPELETVSVETPEELKKVSTVVVPADAYNVINSLPSDYVTDGSVDYTSYLQSTLNKYSNIVFPGFPILINSTGLDVKSGRTLTFLEGAELRMKPTSNKYYMIRIYKASNVTLINPVLVGDRSGHLSTTGEYGHGLNIASSTDVVIKNPKISDCWADGIYINQPEGQAVPKNIEISGGYLSKNRRNGISVISVDGLKILNTHVYGLLESEGGTRPMAGIDFEPNFSYQSLSNIYVSGFKTEKMGAEGIQIIPKNMYGESNKSLNITIDKHEDIASSLRAVYIEFKNPDSAPAITGSIKFTNPVWRKSPQYSFYALGLNEPEIKLTIENPRITNKWNSFISKTETIATVKKFIRSNCNYVIW